MKTGRFATYILRLSQETARSLSEFCIETIRKYARKRNSPLGIDLSILNMLKNE